MGHMHISRRINVDFFLLLRKCAGVNDKTICQNESGCLSSVV